MGGDFGTKIRRAAAAERPFPISGFKVPADWAVSAIVAFTYLDLVFERGLPPEDAVREMRAVLTFGGDPNEAEAPIEGKGLDILATPP